jgi:hypothetical protein
MLKGDIVHTDVGTNMIKIRLEWSFRARLHFKPPFEPPRANLSFLRQGQNTFDK